MAINYSDTFPYSSGQTFADELNSRFVSIKNGINVSLQNRDDWDNTFNYSKNDVVKSNGSYWISKTSNLNSQPIEGLDWTYLSQTIKISSTTELGLVKLNSTPSDPSNPIVVEAGKYDLDLTNLNSTLANKSNLNHIHDATEIQSGILDLDRIPIIPSSRQIISSGDLVALTSGQKSAIGSGTVVTITDGRRFVYSGTGDKTLEESYVLLADITPAWSTIENKPLSFIPSSHNHPSTEITGLGNSATKDVGTQTNTVAAGNDARIVNALQNNVGSQTVSATDATLNLTDSSRNNSVMFNAGGDYPRLAFVRAGNVVGQLINSANDFIIDAGQQTIDGKITFRTRSNENTSIVLTLNAAACAFANPVTVAITGAQHSFLQSEKSVSIGSDTAFTAATTLTNQHHACYFDTTSANINQSLPSATGLNGREYKFFKTVLGNSLTITPPTNQGIATTLTTLDSCVVYRAFNSKWRRVSLVN